MVWVLRVLSHSTSLFHMCGSGDSEQGRGSLAAWMVVKAVHCARVRSVCLSYQKGRADELRASPTPTPCGCPSWPGQLSALCLALPALRVLSPGSGPRSLASRISPSAFPPQHGDSGSHHPGAGHCCITVDSLEAAQGAPRDPRRDSKGERSPWLPLETRPDSPGDDVRVGP